ncbi:GAF domain-containing protein [Cryptococcus bacillisporus CA1873]|uniref:GAF domain-containing protein n=1 Tax=Cryptococcus bacillisporus CA1873 TaxID=1296111 RepID=A0ABR5B4F6_CRYGA|nr:GAF domain-containing protein [Cryptococcus bacillisporus CA1873]|eukprot:KIR58465.1 GAF domain-containing protein [Cryptococcus gattii CA1873]
MPHADSSYIPDTIASKAEFYDHVVSHLEALLEGERYWVTNLSQASAILYHSFLACSLYGGNAHSPVVNWCGFYLHPPAHPSSSSSSSPLLLGPYHGRPACLSITPTPGKGVCADAFVNQATLIVPDVETYPGHIACDGDTKSEIVVPLRNRGGKVIGVLDLDSTQLATYDEEDKKGLERVADILTKGCDWV